VRAVGRRRRAFVWKADGALVEGEAVTRRGAQDIRPASMSQSALIPAGRAVPWSSVRVSMMWGTAPEIALDLLKVDPDDIA
jgi:hypothetical protein